MESFDSRYEVSRYQNSGAHQATARGVQVIMEMERERKTRADLDRRVEGVEFTTVEATRSASAHRTLNVRKISMGLGA